MIKTDIMIYMRFEFLLRRVQEKNQWNLGKISMGGFFFTNFSFLDFFMFSKTTLPNLRLRVQSKEQVMGISAALSTTIFFVEKITA